MLVDKNRDLCNLGLDLKELKAWETRFQNLKNSRELQVQKAAREYYKEYLKGYLYFNPIYIAQPLRESNVNHKISTTLSRGYLYHLLSGKWSSERITHLLIEFILGDIRMRLAHHGQPLSFNALYNLTKEITHNQIEHVTNTWNESIFEEHFAETLWFLHEGIEDTFSFPAFISFIKHYEMQTDSPNDKLDLNLLMKRMEGRFLKFIKRLLYEDWVFATIMFKLEPEYLTHLLDRIEQALESRTFKAKYYQLLSDSKDTATFAQAVRKNIKKVNNKLIMLQKIKALFRIAESIAPNIGKIGLAKEWKALYKKNNIPSLAYVAWNACFEAKLNQVSAKDLNVAIKDADSQCTLTEGVGLYLNNLAIASMEACAKVKCHKEREKSLDSKKDSQIAEFNLKAINSDMHELASETISLEKVMDNLTKHSILKQSEFKPLPIFQRGPLQSPFFSQPNSRTDYENLFYNTNNARLVYNPMLRIG
jgi:hypothetical protein